MIKSLTIKSLPISLAALLILFLQATSAQAARIYNKTDFDEIMVIGTSAFIFDETPEIIIDRGTRSDSLEWKSSTSIWIAGSIAPTLYPKMSKAEKKQLKTQHFCDEMDRKRLNSIIKIPAPDRTKMKVCWRPLMFCGNLHTPLWKKMVGGNYAVVTQRDASGPYEFISSGAGESFKFACSGRNELNIVNPTLK
jgi:hemolysin-activating ACP:hemolysin acyltransferase